MSGFGTRDAASMRAYARDASTVELRAVLAQAERDGDRELAVVLRTELERRERDGW